MAYNNRKNGVVSSHAMKILFVCLGNICRSPLAEGILKNKVANLPIQVDSAGTAAYHIGENPDHRAVYIAKKHGVNIGKLKGRQFDVDDFDNFDAIYAMDKENLKHILKLSRGPSDEAKVKLLVEELYPNSQGEVPDPFFGGPEGFEEVYKLLDEATDKIVERYSENYGG